MIRRLTLLAAVGLLSVGTGCSSFDHLDLVPRSAPPDGGSVRWEEIRIHEGIAVGFAAYPMEDGNDRMDEETEVRLETADPEVVDIATAPREEDDGDEAPYEFVIWGVNAGQSELGVFIDGEFERAIPVVIDPQ